MVVTTRERRIRQSILPQNLCGDSLTETVRMLGVHEEHTIRVSMSAMKPGETIIPAALMDSSDGCVPQVLDLRYRRSFDPDISPESRGSRTIDNRPAHHDYVKHIDYSDNVNLTLGSVRRKTSPGSGIIVPCNESLYTG